MFGKLFRKTRQMGPPMPDLPLQVVGDIHGRADLLERVLDKLDMAERIVFVGDYIDRGDFSKDVLERLLSLSSDGRADIICLLGNHEEMLLRVLDGKTGALSQWLRHGGLQTIASFGLSPPPSGDDDAEAVFRERLSEALGTELLGWLHALSLYHQSGTVGIVHAGADPEIPLAAQPRDTLLWGHPKFTKLQRSDDLWIVHGHTIQEAARAKDGRIALDTGAYATGQLSAVRIGVDGEITFLHS